MMTSQKAQQAIERKCKPCNPACAMEGLTGVVSLNLKTKPYVYGLMPRKRTIDLWRLKEARRMGCSAWYWVDDYTDQRLGKERGLSTNKLLPDESHGG